jgi:uncharacterized protein YjbJ (UPF0337 family)
MFIYRISWRRMMKPSTQDQIKGTLREMKGKVKETGHRSRTNPNLAADGQDEKLAGKVQKRVCQLEKTVREVNEPVSGGRPAGGQNAFCEASHSQVALGHPARRVEIR